MELRLVPYSDPGMAAGIIQVIFRCPKNEEPFPPGGTEPVYVNGKLQKQFKDDVTNSFMHPHDVYETAMKNLCASVE